MKYEITIEQINELVDTGNYGTVTYLKKWFPDAFKPKWFTGWAKDIRPEKHLWLGYFEENKLKYAIDYLGNWRGSDFCEPEYNPELDREATTQEVETALIAEAKKRGFKEGVWFSLFKNKYQFIGNEINLILNNSVLSNDGNFIFNSGVWAEIIPTMTKEQAEKELNCKII